MKNTISLMLALLLACSLCVANVYAVEMETGTIYVEENYSEIAGLEDDILSDLYTSSLSERSAVTTSVTDIDFELAQEVYVFTPEAFLDVINSEDFWQLYSIEGTPVWKVPVNVSSKNFDYAIVGQKQSGEYDYTTVSAPIEYIESMEYLFYPEETNNILRNVAVEENKIAVLSVPMYELDFIVLCLDNGATTFIPYTQCTDLQNGIMYSKAAIADVVTELIAQNTVVAADVGGSMGSAQAQNEDNFAGVIMLCILTMIMVYICAKQWHGFRREM